MTTLKTYHADEIASAMSAQLKDEGFVGLYRKAEANWWQKGPASRAFKTEMDAAKTQQEAVAVHNKWLASGSEGATKLGKEHDDFTPLIEYSEERRMKLGSQSAEDAKDSRCARCGKESCACDQAVDGRSDCTDGGALTVAIDFAIRHMVKVADALDKTGFVGVASLIDETLQKLAVYRPFVVKAARSYKGWVSFLAKKSPKAAEKFKKTYKGALEHAKKEKGLSADKAEEYAIRTALDGVPKSYLKEPTPEHGKGKSGPKVTKKAADSRFPKLTDEIMAMWFAIPDQMKDQVIPNRSALNAVELSFQLSGPEAQKRLRSMYERFNRLNIGDETPSPQVGKTSRYYRGKLVGQVQTILNQGGIPVKVDNIWGPKTAKAWNAFLDKAGLSTYTKANPNGTNPPLDDMRLLVNYGDQILAGMKPSAVAPAARLT